MKLIKFYAQCISLFSLFLLFSCGDDIELKPSHDDPDPVSTIVVAYLLNNKGEDLLDETVKGYIDAKEIRLYDIINGEEVLHYSTDTGSETYGIYYSPILIKNNLRYIYIELGEKYKTKDGKYENIIRWDENRSDKIKIERKGRFIRKIWVNGELALKNDVPNIFPEIQFVF